VTVSENFEAFAEGLDTRPVSEGPVVDERSVAALESIENAIDQEALGEAADAIQRDLVQLGFVSFDGPGASNSTSGAMVCTWVFVIRSNHASS
jgi:hypothetical protein